VTSQHLKSLSPRHQSHRDKLTIFCHFLSLSLINCRHNESKHVVMVTLSFGGCLAASIDVAAIQQGSRSPAAGHDWSPRVGCCFCPSRTPTVDYHRFPVDVQPAVASYVVRGKWKEYNNDKYVYIRALLVILWFLFMNWLLAFTMRASRTVFMCRTPDSDQTSDHGRATVWTERRDNTVSIIHRIIYKI